MATPIYGLYLQSLQDGHDISLSRRAVEVYEAAMRGLAMGLSLRGEQFTATECWQAVRAWERFAERHGGEDEAALALTSVSGDAVLNAEAQAKGVTSTDNWRAWIMFLRHSADGRGMQVW